LFFFTEFNSPNSLNTQRGWHTSTQGGTEKYQSSSRIVTSNLMLQRNKLFCQPDLAKLMWKT